MEGYKKYGAFTILAWKTWQKRYQDFIESLKRPADLVITELEIENEVKQIQEHMNKNKWPFKFNK